MELNYDKLEEDLKKPRKNSKRKGSTFERKICNLFSVRFSETFNRTPGSGAFASTHKDATQFSGDILTPEGFRYVIECKRGYSLEILDFFNSKSVLWDFVRQVRKDSVSCGKPWIIIYKKDRKKELLICAEQWFYSQHGEFSLPKGHGIPEKVFVYKLEDVLKEDKSRWFL